MRYVCFGSSCLNRVTGKVSSFDVCFYRIVNRLYDYFENRCISFDADVLVLSDTFLFVSFDTFEFVLYH